MASSDDEYVQNGSSGDENDMQLDDSRASTGRASTLGARPRPATKSKGKGKGKGQASGQTAAGRQRWEFSAQDATAASVRQGVDGSITDSVEGMIEAEKRRRWVIASFSPSWFCLDGAVLRWRGEERAWSRRGGKELGGFADLETGWGTLVDGLW